MATLNATKLFLPLTNQPKLTLTLTLTLTDTVTVIFYAHFVDTHKRLFRINEGNFFALSHSEVLGGPIFLLVC